MPKPETKHYGVLEISPGINPIVDIIAIHGLNGHREKSWTTDSGTLWLRDLLPSSLRHARVLTYGYDADTQNEECVSTLNMRQQAVKLAQDISRKRKDTPRRPIIFVAHDLGGIILKWALVECNNQQLDSKCDLRNILVSTHAILFFGTPHSGVESDFIETFTQFLSAHMKTTDVILKDLRANSSELITVQSFYVRFGHKIHTVFFHAEYEATLESGKRTLNVPSHSASIAGDAKAETIALHSNHRDLVRFPSPESDDYKTVLYYLENYANNASNEQLDKWFREENMRVAAKGGPIVQPDDISFILHLPISTFVSSSVHSPCLQGTREAVLETIWRWADDDTSDKPIFWLCDIAGSGKSTVAMSAVQKWKSEERLGGQFFFSISSIEASNTEKFCSTMARELAQYIPELGPYIASAVKQNPAIVRKSFNDQFQTLVTDPLQHLQKSVILVIDALDECKSGSQRHEILESLVTGVQKSKKLRVFIASRPDRIIEKALRPLSIKSALTDRLHDTVHHDNVDDIAVYVDQSLGGVPPVLSQEKRHKLVEKANGLFIWASTACRILKDETSLINPENTYDRLVSIDQPGAIDDVYNLILDRTAQEYRAVMYQMLAMILAAFEPLTVFDLEDWAKHVKVAGSVELLVQNLGSVLKKDPVTSLVQFRHPTFVEYLRRRDVKPNVTISKELLIDSSNAHGQAASWCFKCLLSPEGLKFNICRIESSFYLNKQIKNLEAKISKHISRRLRYASSHWLFHLAEADDGWRQKLEVELKRIVGSQYVLHWMEVLSVTGGVQRAIDGLRTLMRHRSFEQNTSGRITEIQRFMMASLVPLSESAPHIYISALPFSPSLSYLHIEGAKEYPRTLKVTQGLEETYHGLPQALRGHRIHVNSVCFSPDGLQILSSSSDQTIQLWDAETGQPLGEPLQGHYSFVMSAAFSPDGSRIVSGAEDSTMRLWDARTGRPLGRPLGFRGSLIQSVAFSPDGSRIVVGGSENMLLVCDGETGHPLVGPLEGHTDTVQSVAFSPDSSRIISGSHDRTIRLWDAKTGQPLGKPLRGHNGGVLSVAFSPDGLRIASGSGDWTIRLWDAVTCQALGEPLVGHNVGVLCLKFSPDSSRIVSSSGDKTVRLWDAVTGRPLGEPLRGHNDQVRGVAFSPDGNRIVSCSMDLTIRFWDAKTGQPLGEPPRGNNSSVCSVAISPDGSRILLGSDDRTIRSWDAKTGQPLGEPLQGHDDEVDCVKFSPDGTQIVSASHDHTIRLWDTETGRPLGEPLRGHSAAVVTVAFSLDGSRIVSGSEDTTIRLWKITTNKKSSKVSRGHHGFVRTIFSKDGWRILSGLTTNSKRRAITVNVESLGEPLRGHSRGVWCVACSPDGSRIASGSTDATICLWDVETGQQVGTQLKGHRGWVWSLAFSPDGSRIVSASQDHTIRLWDAKTGQPLGEPLRGHYFWVRSVAFSPDGSRIVSASQDKMIRLWDGKTGQPLLGGPLKGHDNAVVSAIFSPDGSRIISGSKDQTIRVWDVADVSEKESKTSRNLNHEDLGTPLGISIPGFGECYLSEKGWVRSSGRYLFWVPPEYRPGLDHMRLVLNIPTSTSFRVTKLDFTNFKCGEFWTSVRKED